MQKTSTFLLLLGLISLNSCFVSFDSKDEIEGNGEIIEESLEQESFTGLSINGVFEVILHPGQSHSITMTGDENLIQEIKVELKNGILDIRSEKNFKSKKSVKIDVYAENFEEIKIFGAADCSADEVLSGDKIHLDIGGAGNIQLAFEVGELDTNISGAGNLNLSGTADVLDVQISGAANLLSYELETHKAKLRMSGAGNAEVYADEELTVSLSGLGRVSYKGNPPVVNKKVSGLGVVSEG
ncbi:MAG: head GIN domain-containing protein [Bacteroidota bacterium]